MPTLADIYSAIDSAKRRAADTFANPVTSLQQMLGNANDRARVLNQMTAAAAQEGADFGPASQALAQKLADAYNPVGMTVYHGSPHLFEKFDLSKIGTGEGNQSYGRGLYMAQSPGVAKDYQQKLAKEKTATDLNTRMNFVNVGNKPLGQFNVDMDQALIDAAMAGKENFINLANQKLQRWKSLAEDQSYQFPKYAQDKVSAYENLISTASKSPVEYTGSGQFYKVDLPDTHVRRMLDFDAPLKSQPKQVRDLAKTLGMDLNDLGGDLVAKVGKGEEGKQILQKAGIRGIKYFDQMSRGEETGTRNFVVFDPSHLTILERNNQPIK